MIIWSRKESLQFVDPFLSFTGPMYQSQYLYKLAYRCAGAYSEDSPMFSTVSKMISNMTWHTGTVLRYQNAL